MTMKGFVHRLVSDVRWIAAFVITWSTLFLGFYLPLDDRIDQMDVPLQDSWRRLSLSMQTNRLGGMLTMGELDDLPDAMNATLSRFMDNEAELISRILLTESDQSKLESPFQLVEYENALATLQESIRREAAASKVGLAAEVLDGLPQHSTGVDNPSFLWVDFALAKHLLSLSIACQPERIDAFETLLTDSQVPEDRGLRISRFRLQMLANMASVQQLIRTLPLRGSEAKELGLPSPYWERPALYVGGVMLQKAGPAPDDKVTLDLLVEGFHYHNLAVKGGSGK